MPARRDCLVDVQHRKSVEGRRKKKINSSLILEVMNLDEAWNLDWDRCYSASICNWKTIRKGFCDSGTGDHC